MVKGVIFIKCIVLLLVICRHSRVSSNHHQFYMAFVIFFSVIANCFISLNECL
jgi:hypothetical protein